MTCKTVKERGKDVRKCTTKVLSGTVKFTATAGLAKAVLKMGGVVYATGTAQDRHGSVRLSLSPLREVHPGRYTLTLVSGTGRHTSRTSQPLTLVGAN